MILRGFQPGWNFNIGKCFLPDKKRRRGWIKHWGVWTAGSRLWEYKMWSLKDLPGKRAPPSGEETQNSSAWKVPSKRLAWVLSQFDCAPWGYISRSNRKWGYISRSDKKWDDEIPEEESLYGGKGGLDCHPHVSSRQTVCDLCQGDQYHNMFVSTFLWGSVQS